MQTRWSLGPTQPALRPSRSPPSFVLADLTRTPPAPLLPSSFYPVSQYTGGNMAAYLLTWAKQWRIHGPQSVICPFDEVELRLHNAVSSFFLYPPSSFSFSRFHIFSLYWAPSSFIRCLIPSVSEFQCLKFIGHKFLKHFIKTFLWLDEINYIRLFIINFENKIIIMPTIHINFFLFLYIFII